MRRLSRKAAVFTLGLLAFGEACGDGRTTERSRDTSGQTRRAPSCAATATDVGRMPRVDAEQTRLAHWLERAEAYGPLDAPLLDEAGAARHRHALARVVDGRPLGHDDVLGPVDRRQIEHELSLRLGTMRARIEAREYVAPDGSPIEAAARAAFAAVPALLDEPTLHVARGPVRFRCGPRVEPLYKPDLDAAYDRNNCSTARPGELVQILARPSHGLRLARSPYTFGFVEGDAALSPALDRETIAHIDPVPRYETTAETELSAGARKASLPPFVRLHALRGEADAVLVADEAGAFAASIDAAPVRPVARPLTRRAFLTEAFRWLDTPYGWGDAKGGRDCSRFVMDVLASFDVEMPRPSARQQHAGTFSIAVPPEATTATRVAVLDRALSRGVVLLHLPGHIMIYLGRDARDRPMVIHSLGEYVVPCATGDGRGPRDGEPLGETVHRVGRVVVSDLELGRGSSRRALIERIDRVVVIGGGPDAELAGIATTREAAAFGRPATCNRGEGVRLFHSPARPIAGEPLRVLAYAEEPIAPATLAIFDPSGGRIDVPPRALTGPPYALRVDLEHAPEGTLTAVVGDGETTFTCDRFRVTRAGKAAAGPVDSEPVERPAWRARRAWNVDTEGLYSAFVSSLFEHPLDDEVTWPNLQVRIVDPRANLLHDHLGFGEDAALALEPDCADLPYFLRTYFAWKLALPMTYRPCARGRAGQPPTCGDLRSSADGVTASNDVDAFRTFLRGVRSGVHSGTARTRPTDDATDLYPVALDRASLRPGTVYADPDGHLLVVSSIVPQTFDRYGLLLAVDAQPDATVGRRRFWEGTFLFTPDTTNVGAGFKVFRPPSLDREGAVRVPTNAELGPDARIPASMMQYEGSREDFYTRVDALVNPWPIDAEARLASLVDALEESTLRRVTSIEVGEAYMRAHPGTVVAMPEGYDVFETTGTWEDYATPSRDMRLLVAIDTVLAFPAAVVAQPARYGLDAHDASRALTRLQSTSRTLLASKKIAYTRSDGSRRELTLAEVVERARDLEVAYNPNDCVELRWGAPPDSAEASTCARRAPAVQRARMERYRAWFHARARPPR